MRWSGWSLDLARRIPSELDRAGITQCVPIKLHGDLEGHWAVDVSGNWRLLFAFEGEHAVLVDYQDYH
jgi:hypothetical protein